MEHSERFIESVLDPILWEEKAQALLQSAQPLEARLPEFWAGVRSGTGWRDEFVAIYFMLSGLAIENLLKARLVRLNRETFEKHLRSQPSLPSLLNDHDLHRLACRAGLKALANEEEALLRKLTRSVRWYARYPIPVKAAELERFVPSRATGEPLSLSQLSSGDPSDIKRIAGYLGAPGAA